MIGKLKVVHLIGSTKGNDEIFRKAEVYFTKLGYIVFKPVFYVYDDYIKNKELIDDMCYEKLIFSDIICLVTPEHYGESTIKRIQQAKILKKDILIFDGKKSYLYDKH